MIIDIHAHIYPDKIASKAVQAIGTFYQIPMIGGGTKQTLLHNAREAGINITCVSSVATVKEQVKTINRYILSEITGNPELRGFITLHPDQSPAEIESEISFAKQNGFLGIKLHPDFQRFRIDGPQAEEIFKRAENFRVLLHTGDKRYDFSSPPQLIKTAKKHKSVQFHASHFGGYSEWEKLDGYIDTPNVCFDTSSSLAFLSVDTARGLIQKFGADRFMFGSDFPMWNQKQELLRLFSLKLSQNDLDMILYSTAEKFYGNLREI